MQVSRHNHGQGLVLKKTTDARAQGKPSSVQILLTESWAEMSLLEEEKGCTGAGKTVKVTTLE